MEGIAKQDICLILWESIILGLNIYIGMTCQQQHGLLFHTVTKMTYETERDEELLAMVDLSNMSFMKKTKLYAVATAKSDCDCADPTTIYLGNDCLCNMKKQKVRK